MLNEEELKLKLGESKKDNWEKEVLMRVRNAGVTHVGKAWISHELQFKPQDIKQVLGLPDDWKKLFDVATALPLSDLTALLKATYPKLADLVEGAITVVRRYSYGRSYGMVIHIPDHPSRDELVRVWCRDALIAFRGFDPDAEWLAAWAPHLENIERRWGAPSVAVPFLVSEIARGGDTARRVEKVLRESSDNSHDVGCMGDHVIGTWIQSDQPALWQFVKNMLLAAKREEGLRDSILGAVPNAHPHAVTLLLRTIVENNLTRFSSCVAAVNQWFSLSYDSMSVRHAHQLCESALAFLDDPHAREKAFKSADMEQVFLALWAEAQNDWKTSLQRSADLLRKDPSNDRRFVAALFLGALSIPETIPALLDGVDDEDIRVATHALTVVAWHDAEGPTPDAYKAFRRDRLVHGEKLYKRFSKKEVDFKPKWFPWILPKVRKSDVLDTLAHCVDCNDAESLISYVDEMSVSARYSLVSALTTGAKPVSAYKRFARRGSEETVSPVLSEKAKELFRRLLGDASKSVREIAFQAMTPFPITDGEREVLESLLQRQNNELRTSVLLRVFAKDDAFVFAFAERLLSSRQAAPRRGGLELLGMLAKHHRSTDRAVSRAKEWLSANPNAKAEEKALLDFADTAISTQPRYQVIDCFGLLDEARFIKAPSLPSAGTKVLAKLGNQGLDLLWKLHAFVEKNKTTQLPIRRDTHYASTEEVLLGSQYLWSAIDASNYPKQQSIEPWPPQVVKDLLRAWETAADITWTETTRHELLCAFMQSQLVEDGVWPMRDGSKFIKAPCGAGTSYLLRWAIAVNGDESMHRYLFDCAETSAVLLPVLDACEPETAVATGDSHDDDVDDDDFDDSARGKSVDVVPTKTALFTRRHDGFFAAEWVRFARALPLAISDDSLSRLLRLVRHAAARERPFQEEAQLRLQRKVHGDLGRDYKNYQYPAKLWLSIDEFLKLWQLGLVNEQDLYRRVCIPDLCDPNRRETVHSYGEMRDFLFRAGGLRNRYQLPADTAKQVPWPASLTPYLLKVWERALTIEFARGDAPSEVTGMVRNGNPSGGATTALRALVALRDDRLSRSANYFSTGEGNRSAVMSEVIQHSRVGAFGIPDTIERFCELATELGVSENRLIQLAVYAPQWAKYVEAALKWTGMEEAVWWIHGHTKDSEWRIEDDVREVWDARIAEYTPIEKDELRDGAVDAAWFTRMHEKLGSARWTRIYDAAKYACSGIGHKRAQLFADAIQGVIKEKDVLTRINAKRHQDSVRALGLLPLHKGDKGRVQVRKRYEFMQEFRRTSRKHGGSMLQASEKRAVEIGMENLARLAGYPDPLRLQWAMETEATTDLAKGPITVRSGECVVSLAIESDGTPTISCVKKGKSLATVPAATKKVPTVKALFERATLLRRQVSRSRLALELAMCRGDVFEGRELTTLMTHPLLRHMIERLVCVAKDKHFGYPDKKGNVLRSWNGSLTPLSGADPVRIAHPLDLLSTKQWSEWQRECFSAERVQPFKQVFREVYPILEAERKGAMESLRYQGHQLQPRQAIALLGARGWVSKPEEGVQRTYHKERVTAFVNFEEYFFTPAEIDGLTMRGVSFAQSGTREPLAIEKVSARVLSEVMRDLDLVVSVAHRGGVDPEASASSIELRAALLRETCELLRLSNVKVETTKAVIKGELATYAVHLGSANIQKLPGGAVWVVPVHAHHRGRLFLPFADSDPKTAELITKVMMLARDKDIKDPSIVSQIRA